MARKRNWRKNTWANRPVVSPESEEPSSEPWNQDLELSYSDILCPEQPHLGPYPIYHPPKYFNGHHPYYRHPPTPDPSDELVPVLKNLDYTSSILSNPNQRCTLLDALRKATGRIEYWWPELRDDGTLKMDWRHEREVVIPIPEMGLGYSWGHGRPERVLVVDLMNLSDFDVVVKVGEVGVFVKGEFGGGDGGDGGEKVGGGEDGDGVLVKGEDVDGYVQGEQEEEEMDFKSEEEEEEEEEGPRMTEVPVYYPPSPPPASPLQEKSQYEFEEMMGWILQKQGPGVFDGRLLGGGGNGHGTGDIVSDAVTGALEAALTGLQTNEETAGDEWDDGDADDIL